MASLRTRIILTALVGAVVALATVLSLPFLKEPMVHDEGVYFSVVLSGDLPYVSVFDHKPPLIYAWYAFSLLLSAGEPSMQAVRLLAAVQLSVTALAVAWIGLLLGGRKLAVIAGFMMALTVANQYLQFNANTEAFMLPPLALSLGGFLMGLQTRRARWFWLAGALGGLAAMTKTTGAINLALLAGVLVWAGAMSELSWADVRRWSLALLGGAAAAVGVVVLPFLASGHFSEFWFANVTYNIAYSGASSPYAKLLALPEIDNQVLAGGLFLWVLAGIGAVLIAREARLPLIALLASAAASFIGASLTGREYPHYWIPLTPFAALLAGFAVAQITSNWDWNSLRRRLHTYLLFGGLLIPALFAVAPLYLVSVDEAHRMKYGYAISAERAFDLPEVAAYITSATGPEDRIYNFGNEAQLYVLSDRRPGGYYTRPLAAIGVDPDIFDEMLEELQNDPPALIVDTSYVDFSEMRRSQAIGGIYDIDDEPRERFSAFLDEHYDYDRKVAYAEIYLRKDR